MDYAAFKQHLLTFLWKVNDADLIASLDDLIKMAEGDLTVLLKTQDGIGTVVGSAEHSTYPLPADYRSMISVASPKIGDLLYVPPARIYSWWGGRLHDWVAFYSLTPVSLLLAGPYTDEGIPTPAEQQLVFSMTYQRKVPDFKTADASWVADSYLSIYTYAVLRHAAGFLREDERVATWQNMYSTLVNDLVTEDNHERDLGIMGAMRPAYPAVVERRGRGRWVR
jgi:hypothetical protein